MLTIILATLAVAAAARWGWRRGYAAHAAEVARRSDREANW